MWGVTLRWQGIGDIVEDSGFGNQLGSSAKEEYFGVSYLRRVKILVQGLLFVYVSYKPL